MSSLWRWCLREDPRYMDSYIAMNCSRTNHESCVTGNCACALRKSRRVHAEGGSSCRESQSAADLAIKVRRQIHQGIEVAAGRRGISGPWRPPRLLCCRLAMGDGTRTYIRDGSRRGQMSLFKSLSTVAKVLRVGLGDHIHCPCSKYLKNPPPSRRWRKAWT